MRGSVLSLAGLAACVSVARGQTSAFLGDVHNTNVDEDSAPVGIGNLRPACNTGSTGVGCSVGTNILEALEADDLVTVTNVELGELKCETFEKAEGAEMLDFTLSAGQVVTARKTSFKTLPGDAFTNNVERKVWTGIVDEPEGSADLPRSISMTWSGCDIQSFIMKAITPSKDGGVKTITTVPSGVDSNGIFMLDIYREGEDESDLDLAAGDTYHSGEGGGQRHLEVLSGGRTENVRRPKRDGKLVRENKRKNLEARKVLDKEAEKGVENARLRDPDHDEKDNDIRLLKEYQAASLEEKEGFHGRGLRRIDENNVVMPSGRVLQDSDKPQIDVMVLYTKKAMLESNALDGAVRSNDQMESAIITAFEGANNALVDSGVGFTLRVVYMAEVAYTETSDISDAVYALQSGDHQELRDVHDLRDEYGADLVQLVGFYVNTCGIGFTMQAPTSAFDGYGYSVVHANCLSNYSHIHEIGHNMGANHNRENSNSKHEYAFAYRYCGGDNPYRTLMAYESDCSAAPRVNIFSTPDKSYAGKPQGTETENNARVLNEAMTTVVNFREDRVGSSTPKGSAPNPAPAPASETNPSPESPKKEGTPESAVTTSIYPEKIFNKKMKPKGCFRDDSDDRVMTAGTDMPAVEGETVGMTRDNCMAYCSAKNNRFKYFGVEFGEECFCWKNNKRYKRKGKLDNSACNVPCAGDGETTCGGRDALEVFKMKSVSIEEKDASPSYRGCYRDTWSDTNIDNLPAVDSKLASHKGCSEKCKEGGFTYYGLENGYMCSCNNALPDEASKAKDDQCSLPCTNADKEETCGGKWHMAVFSTDDPAKDSSKQSDAPSVESVGEQPAGGSLGGALSGADGPVEAGEEAEAVGADGTGGSDGQEELPAQRQQYSTDDSSSPATSTYSSTTGSSSSVTGDNYGNGGTPTDVQLEDRQALEMQQP